MSKLKKEFSSLLSRIEINKTKVEFTVRAHTEVRDVLNESELLSEWGLNTVLIGSYARKTGIYPGKDVDIFAKLEKLDTSTSPTKIHNTLFEILEKKYGSRTTKQTRSIKISFGYPEHSVEFSVDIVPAVKYSSIWAIPSTKTELWETGSEQEIWVKTNPEKLTELTQLMNSKIKIDGKGVYVPTVKMIKQIRAHNLKDSKPGGFYFEIMTYWAFNEELKTNSIEEIVAITIKRLRQQIINLDSKPVIDPALMEPFNPQPDSSTKALFLEVLQNLENTTSSALGTDTCQAGAFWRKVFGKNERGVCFPIPDGCDESGKKLIPVSAILSKGPEEADSFAI